MKVVYSDKLTNRISIGDEIQIHNFSENKLIVDDKVKIIFFSLHDADLNYLSHIVKFYQVILVILIENNNYTNNYKLIPCNYDFIVHLNNTFIPTHLTNEFIPETSEQLCNFIYNNIKIIKTIKDRIYYIVASYRPGAMYFTYELEKKLSEIEDKSTLIDDSNDIYDVQVINFDNQNYIISCSPFDFFSKSCEIAHKYKFNVVKGKPYSTKSGHFPFDYPDDCIYTLESSDKHEYTKEELKKLIEKEWMEIKNEFYNEPNIEIKQKIKLKTTN